jgi:hypothetical protein
MEAFVMSWDELDTLPIRIPFGLSKVAALSHT